MDRIIEDKDVLFSGVFQHLNKVQNEPNNTILLDEELLKRAERALDASCPQTLLWRVLNTGETLLQSLQQDPRPLTRLLERTVSLIPFDDLKSVISPGKLIEGLSSGSVPVQLLCLAYLKKASDIPSGASFIACNPDLVHTLITLWLSSSSTEVSERCLEAIIALLAVDNPKTITIVAASPGTGNGTGSTPGADSIIGEAEGQGLMWRRIFQDSEVYSLLFAWTSLTKPKHDLSDKKGQQAVTISQARLFDFILRVASLDWAAITTSTLPQIEQMYYAEQATGIAQRQQEQPQAFGGLLRYAASGMIDSSDFLMEVLRQEFFVKLLKIIEEEHPQGVTRKAIAAIEDDAGVPRDSENASNGMHL